MRVQIHQREGGHRPDARLLPLLAREEGELGLRVPFSRSAGSRARTKKTAVPRTGFSKVKEKTIEKFINLSALF